MTKPRGNFTTHWEFVCPVKHTNDTVLIWACDHRDGYRAHAATKQSWGIQPPQGTGHWDSLESLVQAMGLPMKAIKASIAAQTVVPYQLVDERPKPRIRYGSVPLVIPAKKLPGFTVVATDAGASVVEISSGSQIGRMCVDTSAPAGFWAVKSILVFPGWRSIGLATALLHAYEQHCGLPMVHPADVTDVGSAFFASFKESGDPLAAAGSTKGKTLSTSRKRALTPMGSGDTSKSQGVSMGKYDEAKDEVLARIKALTDPMSHKEAVAFLTDIREDLDELEAVLEDEGDEEDVNDD